MSDTALARVDTAGWMVKHQVPGRVRLQNRLLRGDESLADGIRKALCGLPGVRDVEANATSGSVLVLYDVRMQTVSDLVAMAQTAPAAPVKRTNKALQKTSQKSPQKASKNSQSGGESPPWMSHAAHGLKEFAVSLDEGVRKNTGGKVELRQLVLSILFARAGLQGARAGWAAWETVENAIEFVIAYTLYHHPDVEKEIRGAEDLVNPGL
ncbi:MAG: heavy-metal-associated domain-containing protein [Armatimonadota bacterium]|nr:heavy-metal-associated domain-containing protein [Armatimonadota bacterium]